MVDVTFMLEERDDVMPNEGLSAHARSLARAVELASAVCVAASVRNWPLNFLTARALAMHTFFRV